MDLKDYNKQFNKKSNKKTILFIAAFMVIAIAITVVFFAQTTGDKQGYRTICVVETSGSVSVVKDGIEYSAYPGMLLQEGHEIVTAGNSYVRLVLDDDKYVKIESGSKLVFETLGLLGSGKTRMTLERGSMTSELVNPLESDEEYVVNTPNAVLAVRGTFFRVDLALSKSGEVKADIMTYGGQVASQRVLPTGETVEEEVLIDAGFKASINMTKEDTHYVVETDDGEFIIVEPTIQETPDGEGSTDEGGTTIVPPTMPITTDDIPDDDLVDVYFAAENGHEMFVTVEEVKADIETREIVVEEYKPVYEKAEEIKKEQEAAANPSGGTSNTTSATVIANDSQPLAKVEEETKEEEKPSDSTTTTPTTNTSGLVDGVHEHSKKTTIVEPTCTTVGSEIVTCRSCKEILSTKELPASAHSYATEFTVDKVATCETAGRQSRHCSQCDATTDVTVIPRTEHTYTNTAYVAPSCTKAGSNTYTCDCGHTYTNEVAALGHTEVAGGTEDAHSKCSVCDEVLSIEHTYTETVETAVDCIAPGTMLHSCDCGYVYRTDIEATGHDWSGWTTLTEATCEKDGVNIRQCMNCLSSEETRVPSLGHGYASDFTIDVEATCETAGSKSKHCLRCDSKSEVTEIAALGHDWSGWTEITSATCTTDGENRRECNICYETEKETVLAFGHTEVAVGTEDIHSYCSVCDEVLSTEHEMVNTAYVAPSCTEAGSDSYTCDCGYTYTNEVAALGHSYASDFTIDVEATCTTDGSKSKHCSQCSETTEVTIIAAYGHTEVAGGTEDAHSKCSVCDEVFSSTHTYTETVETAADCIAPGTMLHSCDCGYVYRTDIEATGHDWSEWTEITSATCTTDGENRRECNICYETEKETVLAFGHTEVAVGTQDIHSYCSVCDEVLSTEHEMVQTGYVAPSCTEAGSDTYTCDCGYTYTNEVAALGHSYASEFTIDVEATCTTDGSKSKHCSQCSETTEVTEIAALGHDWSEWTEFTSATCTTDGENRRECNTCYETERETVAASGHTEVAGGTEDAHSKCSVCDEVFSSTHTYTETVETAADCIAPGTMLHSCDCGYVYRTDIEATGHDWSGWTTLTEATCEKDGVNIRQCMTCLSSEETSVPSLGHNYATEFTIDVEATCTTAGSKSKNCSRCDSKSEVTEIAALGHDWSEWTEFTSATCTTDGENRRECNTCYETERETIAATGHTEVAVGTEDVHSYCSVCDEVLSTEHEMVNTAYVAPSCTEAGSDSYTCDCGYTYTNEVAALDHSYASDFTIDVEATCTTAGSKSKHCSQCSETTEVTEIAALGHDWSEWTEFTSATCTTDGENRRECNTCYETEREIVLAFGHTEVVGGTEDAHSKCSICDEVLSTEHEMVQTGYVAPSCTEAGSDSYTCDCGYTYTNEVVALGHSYASDFTVDVEATCETAGSKSKHCSRCDSKSEVTEIAALGHDWSEWTEFTSATCTTDGENRRECNTCYETERETIAATGHTEVAGSTEDIHSYCSVCDEVLSTEHEMINTAYVAPSCTEAGSDTYTCDCGYTYTNEVAALGHSYASDFTIDVEATCTTAGSKSRHCSQCSETTEVTEIPETGHTETAGATVAIHSYCLVCNETLSSTHTYTDTETQAPTCTDSGVMTHTCDCGYSYTTDIDALGHTEVNGATSDAHTICSVCSEILNSTHSYTDTEIQAPTCTNTGVMRHNCDCGYEYTSDIEALGHNYVEKTEEPTDTSDGRTYEECENCGDIINESTIVALNSVNFPDTNFRAYLENTCNTDGNAGLTETEIDSITSLTLKGDGENGQITTDGGISDLTGIEYLSALTYLDVSYNANLTKLGLSGKTYLETLIATGSGVSNVDISSSRRLQTLKLDYCADLGVLDVSSNTNLVELILNDTKLSTLGLGSSYLNSVTWLDIRNTKLDTIDMERFSGAQIVKVDANMSELDLNPCNELTNLYIAEGTALQTLSMSEAHYLDSVIFEGTTGITSLSITESTRLYSLDVSNCPALTSLNLQNTPISDIDVSANTELTSLILNGNSSVAFLTLSENRKLSNLELDNCSLLQFIYLPCRDDENDVDPSLTSLTFTGCTMLNTIDAANCTSLSQLDISDCTALTSLDISATAITGFAQSAYEGYLVVPNTATVTSLSLYGTAINYSNASTDKYTWWGALQNLNLGDASVTQTHWNTISQHLPDTLTTLNLTGSTIEILDLSGRTALSSLTLDECNSLTSLTASGCTALSMLQYNNCQSLATVDISGCTSVTEISVNELPAIESFNASGCTSATSFNAYSGGATLTSLDISGCTNLGELTLNGATGLVTLDMSDSGVTQLYATYQLSLTSIDASNCTALITLDVNKDDDWCSSLETLDITGCTELRGLDVSYCKHLTGELDLSAYDKLNWIRVKESGLTSLNVSNTQLESVSIENCTDMAEFTASGVTTLTELITTGCTSLETLDVSGCTSLTELDTSALTNLKTFIISGSGLESVDVSELTALMSLDASACTGLKNLKAESCTNLNQLNISGCTTLDRVILTGCTSLTGFAQSAQENCIVVPTTAAVTYLDLCQTGINYSDASADEYTWFGALETLLISNAGITDAHWQTISTYLPDTIKVLEIADSTITTLDVSGYAELTGLRISRCSNLTSIDLSNNTELTNLECASSSLTNLDLTQNTKLTSLDVGGSNLAFPDLSNNTALKTLSVGIDGLTSLDVSGLTELYELYIDGANMTAIDVRANTSLGIFYVTNCSELTTINLPSAAYECIGVVWCSKIETLDFSGFAMSYLELGECPMLTSLYLNGCSGMTELNVAACDALTTLDVTDSTIVYINTGGRNGNGLTITGGENCEID